MTTPPIAPAALGAAAALAFAALPHAAAAQAAPSPAACEAMARPGAFANTVVSSAKIVPAAGRTPAHCEVTGVASPVAGSKIGVVYRLPADWNGKIIGYGGGGWAGNMRIETAATDLARGYATLQTDGGHPSANAGDSTWVAPGGVVDEVALNDFAWRGVHTMTEVGKQVAAAFYGRPHQKAYFQGCSTGGRMALMEAQRFPDDYDAIIAGAPVYSLRVQLGEIYRDWIWAQPGAAITPQHIALVHDAVLAQCDKRDGVEDGVLTDPKACGFDPKTLACKAGQSGGQCLTPAQVLAFQRAYTPVTGRDGTPYIFAYAKGSEPGWVGALNISADPVRAAAVRNLNLRAAMFGDPNFSFATFDAVRDTPRARSGAFAKYYEADNPDLKPFLAHGKLILWHGLEDPLPSPFGTEDYWKRMQAAVGPAAAKNTAFFLEPGVLHCGGGPGVNSFDMVAALDTWVSQGAAPTRIVGIKVAGGPPGAPAPATPAPAMSRPVCAYPALPRYDGKGDANRPESFVCR
jgi:feruloyl esterase